MSRIILQVQRTSEADDLAFRVEGLKQETVTYTTRKQELENIQSEIDKLNAQNIILNNSIVNLNVESKNLSASIGTLEADKTRLISEKEISVAELEKLQAEVNDVQAEKSLLETNILESNDEIVALASQNKNLEKEKLIHENARNKAREMSNLYSHDMDGIGEDNKEKRNKYLFALAITFGLVLVLMVLLLCTLMKDSLLSDELIELFDAETAFLFYLVIIIRVTLSAAIVILIWMFISLTRGFVAQYIKSQDRMTSLRILDFLVNRLDRNKVEIADAQILESYRENVLDKQIKLFNEHLPNLMKSGETSFDKNVKSKSVISLVEKLAGVGKKD